MSLYRSKGLTICTITETLTQTNGRPLPIGGFTSRVMTQMIHEITGVIPREVVILTDQEVVFEIEDESSII